MAVVAALAVCASATTARAHAAAAAAPASAPAPAPTDRTGYEARMVERALAEQHLRIDAAPEGKRIRTIHVVAGDIISPDDPYPRILNAVHVTTRDEVIRRELLFAEGETWNRALVEETERNLRGLFIIALARIVPVETDEPGSVDVLVVTKDLWSIRFNSSFNLVGSILQYLRIRPTEQNLLGRDKQLSADFELRLDTVAFGQEYVDHRVLGSRLQFGERASLIFNRATGHLEGSAGELLFAQPLYSLEAEQGFDVDATWDVRRVRLYRGADIWTLTASNGAQVPWIYDQRELGGAGYYTRSFGRAMKWNVSVGAGGYSHAYEPPDPASLTPPEAHLLRAQILPVSEDAAYAAVKLHTFTSNYRVLRNVESFALSEDYQVGPSVRVTVRGGDLFRERAPFFEAGVAARYRLVLGDSLTSASFGGSLRACPSGCSGLTWANERAAAEVLHVSPVLGIGRVAIRGLYETHRNELDRTVVLLGGGNGLRGARPESLSGTRLGLVNLEYRTLPLDLLTLHVGVVAFYDVGTVFAEGERPTQTVGLGLRLLFPQFDVEPIRIDFGYVVDGGTNPRPFQRVSSSFGQVERYRPAFLDEPFR